MTVTLESLKQMLETLQTGNELILKRLDDMSAVPAAANSKPKTIAIKREKYQDTVLRLMADGKEWSVRQMTTALHEKAFKISQNAVGVALHKFYRRGRINKIEGISGHFQMPLPASQPKATLNLVGAA